MVRYAWRIRGAMLQDLRKYHFVEYIPEAQHAASDRSVKPRSSVFSAQVGAEVAAERKVNG